MRPVFTFVNRVPRGFNPRTRKGCDTATFAQFRNKVCFNPRTRKGCDFPITTNLKSLYSFNPRTRKGCDRFDHHVTHATVWFQSTHP